MLHIIGMEQTIWIYGMKIDWDQSFTYSIADILQDVNRQASASNEEVNDSIYYP